MAKTCLFELKNCKKIILSSFFELETWLITYNDGNENCETIRSNWNLTFSLEKFKIFQKRDCLSSKWSKIEYFEEKFDACTSFKLLNFKII